MINYRCLYCPYTHTDLETFRKHLHEHRMNKQQLALQIEHIKLQGILQAFKDAAEFYKERMNKK